MKATIPICALLGGTMVSHEIRLARIEESRFTDADAHLLERRLVESLGGVIRVAMTTHEARPHVDAISRAEFKAIVDQLSRIEARLQDARRPRRGVDGEE